MREVSGMRKRDEIIESGDVACSGRASETPFQTLNFHRKTFIVSD